MVDNASTDTGDVSEGTNICPLLLFRPFSDGVCGCISEHIYLHIVSDMAYCTKYLHQHLHYFATYVCVLATSVSLSRFLY